MQTQGANPASSNLSSPDSQSFQQVVSQMPVHIAVYKGPQLIIEAASKQWLAATQRDEAVIGHPLLEAVPELADQPFPALILRVIETGEPLSGVDSLVHLMRDGKLQEAYFDFTYSPLRNEKGVVDRVVSVATEVTGKVQARKEQQKLLAVIDNSAEFVGLSGPDNHIVYLNAAGKALVGLSPDVDVTTLHAKSFYAPGDHQIVRDEVMALLESSGKWSGRIHIRHFETGEIIPCHASYILIRDEATGQTLARAATLRDLRSDLSYEAELAHSEQRFRTMIQQAPVAIGLLRGYDMIIETANADILKLWGKDEQIIGKTILEGLPEIRDQDFLELLQQVYTSGEAHYGYETLAVLEREGKSIQQYFNFVYAPVRDIDGSVSGILVIATDVTEQVRTRKELESSERRFRGLIQEAPVATAVYTGREMRISFANDAMLNVWGKDSKVIGKTLQEALPALAEQPFHQILDNVFTSGKAYKADADRVDLEVDGALQTFYYNFVYKPLRDANGNIYAILNMAVNVTVQHEASRKIADAEERLRIAIDSAELGTWSLDLEKQTISFSDRFKEIYGFDNNTEPIADAAEVVPVAHRERIMHTMQQSLHPDSGGIYADEYPVINRKTGEQRQVRASGKTFFTKDGLPYLMIGTVQDITEQKIIELELEARVEERTEALRKANNLLQQSNQNLQQFAYVSSHDLQEPLRKILVFSGMLKESKALDVNGKEYKYAHKISESAQRMQLLIRDLLDYSKADEKEHLFEPTDLNMVIRNIRQDFELLINQKNAALHIASLPTIEAIPLQMNQLFYNLVGNALKFTKEWRAPVIDINCRRLEPAEVAGNPDLNPGWSYCAITIRDNGIGFDQAFSDKIFTVFQRLHTREEYEGTGIGLALCMKIVQNHGGTIVAESEPDKGATFHLILPERRVAGEDKKANL